MFQDGATSTKVPLDESAEGIVQRLGRWMRVVGSIQLAFTGLGLLGLIMFMACGVAFSGPSAGAVVVLFSAVIPLAVVAAFLLQALRTQAAGEQFKNLAEEHDTDYLELAFLRLKTVYIIDIVAGVLLLISLLGGEV